MQGGACCEEKKKGEGGYEKKLGGGGCEKKLGGDFFFWGGGGELERLKSQCSFILQVWAKYACVTTFPYIVTMGKTYRSPIRHILICPL